MSVGGVVRRVPWFGWLAAVVVLVLVVVLVGVIRDDGDGERRVRIATDGIAGFTPRGSLVDDGELLRRAVRAWQRPDAFHDVRKLRGSVVHPVWADRRGEQTAVALASGNRVAVYLEDDSGPREVRSESPLPRPYLPLFLEAPDDDSTDGEESVVLLPDGHAGRRYRVLVDEHHDRQRAYLTKARANGDGVLSLRRSGTQLLLVPDSQDRDAIGWFLPTSGDSSALSTSYRTTVSTRKVLRSASAEEAERILTALLVQSTSTTEKVGDRRELEVIWQGKLEHLGAAVALRTGDAARSGWATDERVSLGYMTAAAWAGGQVLGADTTPGLPTVEKRRTTVIRGPLLAAEWVETTYGDEPVLVAIGMSGIARIHVLLGDGEKTVRGRVASMTLRELGLPALDDTAFPPTPVVYGETRDGRVVAVME